MFDLDYVNMYLYNIYIYSRFLTLNLNFPIEYKNILEYLSAK